MQESDVLKFLIGLEAKYPTFQIKDISTMTSVWFEDLKDYTVNELAEAYKVYQATNSTPYAPSVDQLLNCMHKVDDAAQMTAIQAWGCVSKAVRNSNYNAQSEWNNLPDLIKTFVTPNDLHNWAQTDLLVLESTIAKQFQYSYEVAAKREREFRRYPAEVQSRISALTSATLASLPQFENPVPVVTAKVSNERADSNQIDRQMEKLKGLLS